MGKKNKSRKSTNEPGPVPDHADAPRPSETQEALHQQLGPCILTGMLQHMQPDQASRLPVLYFSQLDLTRVASFAGSTCLVGVAEPASASRASQPVLALLWDLLGLYSSSAAASDHQPQTGGYVLHGVLLPSSKLPGGCVALSDALADGLGRPGTGAEILVYQAPKPNLRAPGLALSEDEPEAAVTLTMPLDQGRQLPFALPCRLPSRSESQHIPGQASLLSPMRNRGKQPEEPSQPAEVLAGSPSNWVLQVLSQQGERQRGLLQRLAAQHLAGFVLQPGNPVVLPLMGQDVVFRVQSVSINGQAGTAARMTSRSSVLLLPATDQAADGEAQPSADAQVSIAERAAQAAQKALDCGPSDAGPEAARRAAEAGARALKACQGLSSLGGLADVVAQLRHSVHLPLQDPGVFARFGLRPSRGVLLWGPSGTGKSQLAVAIAADAGAKLLLIQGPDIVSQYYGESEASIQGIFAAARALAPAVVFIDEADVLGSSRPKDSQAGSASAGGSSRTLAALLTALDGANTGRGGDRVVIIAASSRADQLDSALRRPGRLDIEVEIGVPSPAQRLDIFRVLTGRMKHSLSAAEEASFAAAAHGFVGADLVALTRVAGLNCLRRFAAETTAKGPLQVTLADFEAARAAVRPSALREVALELPRVRWSDVGGLEDVKASLQEAVQWPLQHAASFARLGAKAPRGVLLMGPPGCSKTLLARALAGEAGLNFLAVKGPELLSKWVGASEQAVAAAFARARAAAPAIIFFDEIDGLATNRAQAEGGGGASLEARVLATLLSEMDGLQGREGVVVIGATNRPDRLDSALLRPGRFDRLQYVGLPDEAARLKILEVLTRKTPLQLGTDLSAIAACTQGYTGADLAAVIKEGGLAAIAESPDIAAVGQHHFTAALQVVPASPSPSSAALAVFQKYQRHSAS